MNVYDFDKTIFYPNSTFKYLAYCLLHYPKVRWKYAPKAIRAGVRYKLGRITKMDAALVCLSFPGYVPDFDKSIEAFWDREEKNVRQWYLNQKKEDDLIISASPECIVRPLADRLGVRLVGTDYNWKENRFTGPCMYGRHKAKYLINSGIFLSNVIDEFYSDSIYDTPLALCAETAFLVKNRAKVRVPWPKVSDLTKDKKFFKRIRLH